MENGTIWIVDDNKSVLASLELLLENEFGTVRTAGYSFLLSSASECPIIRRFRAYLLQGLLKCPKIVPNALIQSHAGLGLHKMR